ncbi:MAG: hypothetical protein ACRYFS_17285 [Janthinobacterium lividum]
MHTGMLVCCKTDDYDFGHCAAVFEVASRKQAAATRKLLFALLPSKYHSSIQAISWTKQRYLEWRLAISTQAGLPLGPVKWFAPGDKVLERFEDLQVSPEVRQSFLEELQEVLRQKPGSYWGGFRSFFVSDAVDFIDSKNGR